MSIHETNSSSCIGTLYIRTKCYTFIVKECKYCKKQFPESDFGVAKTTPTKIYRRRKCRYCYRKTKNILKASRRGWLAEHKASLGCKTCGITNHRVLDFHHRLDSTKDFAISEYFYHQFNERRLRDEVKKCDILCANCHRIHHFEMRQ